MVTYNDKGKYTPETLAEFATKQGCSVQQFSKRWIVQSGGAYWVHGPNGYSRPMKISDLRVAMRDLLAPATDIDNGVRLTYTKKNKEGINITATRENDDILHDSSTVATKIVSSMSIPYSYLDISCMTFFERVCPLRRVVPCYDENVDKWLRLLGGDRADKLLDWVATLPQLDRATCAIYLHGKKDTGKTLFATGLSRLWAFGPTEMEEVIADFNSAIADCPLVLADEKIPRFLDSGSLRSFIGKSSHQLRRKGLASSTIEGCLRVVISANSPDLLKFNREDFQREDVDAIASRLLYISVSPEAKEFLDSIGGASGGTADWVKGDKIAAHARWLAENRVVIPGKRFLVEGIIETFHKRLATNGDIRELVIEWICKGLVKTDWPTYNNENPGIRFGHGKLYVNSAFINQMWEMLMSDKQIPSTAKIGKALTPFAKESKKFTVTKVGAKTAVRRGFYEIDTEHIYRVAEELQIGVAETYQALIDQKAWNWSSAADADANGEYGDVAPPVAPPLPSLFDYPPTPPPSNKPN